ncbi:uncharacterized membrane protein YgaE (UPF0421/DUF939 family) [Herbaspirillum sp. Sphag1AN]|nr:MULTISPECIES: hypothetical protein [unclassified Herbaspirillum]MBB3211126.1 uncharacterized membrane protein YgaE (UPF0421/DUF939 family) [Herbaspirillum sp. Sphag1AN]MBB3244755.1 uncharacterized membrane protein YgaE (UPF0421/DUF939 family) [Herbaspirillum sp. Sphag64]
MQLRNTLSKALPYLLGVLAGLGAGLLLMFLGGALPWAFIAGKAFA